MSQPIEHRVEANGLHHCVVEWRPEGEALPLPVVLCHGFLDQAYAFAPLAAELVARGYRCFAADFRGHGRTDWASAGGYYHFADYVLDLDSLFPFFGAERVHLLGHSMGGTVAALYAGARPERIASLVLAEGLGPESTPLSALPSRFRGFLDGVARARPRRADPKIMASLDEALARMRAVHPSLSDELGRFLADKASRAVPGGYAFRYDPLHRTPSPTPFSAASFSTMLAEITAPTLAVFGAQGMRVSDEAARLACIPNARSVELPDVGHMVHWFAAEALGELAAAHMKSAPNDS